MITNADIEEVRDLIRQWAYKQGHGACHYYPRIFQQIANILKVQLPVHLKLPPREEFEKGCKRYQDELYPLK